MHSVVLITSSDSAPLGLLEMFARRVDSRAAVVCTLVVGGVLYLSDLRTFFANV